MAYITFTGVRNVYAKYTDSATTYPVYQYHLASSGTASDMNLHLGYFYDTTRGNGYKEIVALQFTVSATGYYNMSFNTLYLNGTEYAGTLNLHSLITTTALNSTNYNPEKVTKVASFPSTSFTVNGSAKKLLTSGLTTKSYCKLDKGTTYYLWMWGEGNTSSAIFSTTPNWIYYNKIRTDTNFNHTYFDPYTVQTSLSSVTMYTVTLKRGSDSSGVTSPAKTTVSWSVSYSIKDEDGTVVGTKTAFSGSQSGKYSSGTTMSSISVPTGASITTKFVNASSSDATYRTYTAYTTGNNYTTTISKATSLSFYFTAQKVIAYDIYFKSSAGKVTKSYIAHEAGKSITAPTITETKTEQVSSQTLYFKQNYMAADGKTVWKTGQKTTTRTKTRTYTPTWSGKYKSGETFTPTSNLTLQVAFSSYTDGTYPTTKITMADNDSNFISSGPSKDSTTQYNYTFDYWTLSGTKFSTYTASFNASTTTVSITLQPHYKTSSVEYASLSYNLNKNESWISTKDRTGIELSEKQTVYSVNSVLQKKITSTATSQNLIFGDSSKAINATTVSTYSGTQWKDGDENKYTGGSSTIAIRAAASGDINLDAIWSSHADIITYSSIIIPTKDNVIAWTCVINKTTYTFTPGETIPQFITSDTTATDKRAQLLFEAAKSSALTFTAIIPEEDYVYKYNESSKNWDKGSIYIYTNGSWKKTQIYIYSNGSWKTSS